MENKFIVFRDFNELAAAETVAALFNKNNIETQIEHSKPQFEVAFVNTAVNTNNVYLKIKDTDFEKAEALLEKENDAINIEDFPKDYYLFSFNDEALFEILINSEEWGAIDYTLAKKILLERGKPVEEGLLKSLKKQKLEKLAEPEKGESYLIYAGYLFAIVGGIIGFFIGYSLHYEKKQLPNGDKVFKYIEADRKKGITMMIVGGVFSVISIMVKVY